MVFQIGSKRIQPTGGESAIIKIKKDNDDD